MVRIKKIREIEENIWEPRLGIKGKIDVTADCTIKNTDTGQSKELTIPIELKSGKGNSLIQDHQIQTQLYGMVQSYRHDSEVSFKETTSLLSYIRTAKTFSIPIKENEIDQIMSKRNEVAGHVRHPLIKMPKDDDSSVQDYELRPLPGLIDNPRACETCFKRDICAFFAKTENRKPSDGMVQTIFDEDVAHITDKIEKYLKKWIKLGLLEEMEEAKQSRGKELWNAEARDTLNDVTVDKKQPRVDNKYRVTVQLKSGQKWPFGDKSEKNRISISTKNKIAIAFGYVRRLIKPSVMIGPWKVELELDRQLSVEMGPYRIDLANNNAGGGNFSAKLWLGNIWLYSSKENKKLVDVLSGVTQPTLVKIASDNLEKEQKKAMIDVLRKSGINTEQKRAIEICLKMNHFCLIQGFPGSGKSKVICVLLEAFLRMGKTVLLTAHTHSAVDNVLSRLLKRLKESEKKSIVRLGADQKMDLSVRPFAEKNLFDGITRNVELIKLYKSKAWLYHDSFSHAYFPTLATTLKILLLQP